MNDTPHDDRLEFAAQQTQAARALADDQELQRAAMDVTAVSDRHGYSYVWRWLGLPIIQMPTDVVALQELIWAERPQVIVETGIARGGSAVFFASMLQLLGEGHVVAVDIDIRPHNRTAIEEHSLASRIQMIEGSSVDEDIVAQVRQSVGDAERVMVVLDSNHTHQHVLDELRLYSPMVTPGQHLVVADTVVEHLPLQEHRPRPWGPGDNPKTALDAFLLESDRFELDLEVDNKLLMSSNPGGYLRCVR